MKIKLPDEIAADPRFSRVEDEQKRYSAAAKTSQARYLWLTRAFVVGSTFAAIAGGLVLYGSEAQPDDSSPILLHWLAAGQFRSAVIAVQCVSLAIAAGCGYLLGRREPGKRWVAARLKAEECRLLLADRVLRIGHEKGAEAFGHAGVWFLDFLEGQISHLENSASHRDRSALQGLIVAAVLAALAALASGLTSGLTGFDSNALAVMLAIFGVGVPAIMAAIEKWGEATTDGKRAELHADSWSALSALRDDVPAFEASIAVNDLSGAQAFADRVFEVLRIDHAGFAASQRQAISAGGDKD